MSSPPGAVALLVAAAVALLLGTPFAGSRRLRPRRTGRRPRAGHDAWGLSARRAQDGRDDPVRALLTGVVAVASALRAGAAPPEAWRSGLGVSSGPDGAPDGAAVLAAVEARRPGSLTARGDRPSGAARAEVERQVAVLVAATRLAVELGAPLAPVLDRCAETLTAEQEAEADRRAALAGPAQTSRLLGWLPALGLVLGTVLGARPLAVLVDGGPGTLAGVAGVALSLGGRAWVRRMVAGARGGDAC